MAGKYCMMPRALILESELFLMTECWNTLAMDRHLNDDATYLDVRGLRCPLPLLKAKKALTELNAGEVLKVSATDPGSQRDFQAYMDHSSHSMLDSWQVDDVYWYLIKRGD